MSAFPCLVYRCPGPHIGPPGTTYVAESAANESELAAAISAGWFATLPEAVEAFLRPAAASVESTEPATEPAHDDAPPTREELEAKAAELGVKVDKRWSDKTLMEKLDRKSTRLNSSH